MKNRLKINKKPDNRYINGAGKYQKEQYQKRIEAYYLNPKHCLQCNKVLDYKHVKKNTKKVKFCSRSCSATYNNYKKEVTTKGIKKVCKCIVCFTEITISVHKSVKSATCSSCNIPKQKSKTCTICEKIFLTSVNRKTCSDTCKNITLVKAGSKGGRKSVLSQQKRSKNEVYFYELCATKFSNVLHNEQMFNGWDADVILPDLKIAILWNGIWHYKRVHKKHSLKQQKFRDKTKIQEIISLNFIPYIIKDLGGFNTKKVEMEFEIFCKWLNEKGIAGDGTAPSST